MLNVCKASAGTGKTYTLAAYYISLLLSGESYRSILAVTFTNKATAEMKERIVTYLYMLSHDYTSTETKKFLSTVRRYMIRNQNKTDEELRSIASTLFKHIVEDMDHMHIMTIDSFLQSVQQGMFTILQDGTNNTIEIDIMPLINKAVDQVLTTHLCDYKNIQDPLLRYLTEQMDEEKGWDIRKNLIDLTTEIFKESVQVLQNGKYVNLSVEHILQFKQTILEPCKDILHSFIWKNADCVKTLDKLLTTAQTYQHELGKRYQDTLINAQESLAGTIPHDKIFKGFTNQCSKDILEGNTKLGKSIPTQKREEILAQLREIKEFIQECKKLYVTIQLTIAPLNNMSIVGAVIEQIRKNLKNNQALLLAETAFRLYNILKTGDADFILEQSGIRYRHIMIDEAQDTSRMQWNVFEPLISEITSSGGNVLMVGDAKQSIYRWRNGDWHIMYEAEKDYSKNSSTNSLWTLERNFRSRRNIVMFTQEVFKHIHQLSEIEDVQNLYTTSYELEHLHKYYNHEDSDKEGGFVRLITYDLTSENSQSDETTDDNSQDTTKTVSAEDLILEDMFTCIHERIEQMHESPSDMLILVRTKKEGEQVIQYFNQNISKINNIDGCELQIISEDNFFVGSSSSVQLIVHALQYLYNHNHVSALYIESLGLDLEPLEQFDAKMPIYQLVHKIIQIYLLADNNELSDLAYVNYFLDQVQTFSLQQDSSLEYFLQFWQDQLHCKAIPNPKRQAISLMTIHKSKGLEGKNVFIPFCSHISSPAKGKIWCKDVILNIKEQPTYLPIDYNKHLEETLFSPAYQEEKRMRYIDDLNMLYVAITRAKNSLYLYGTTKGKKVQSDIFPLLQEAFEKLTLAIPEICSHETAANYHKYTCGEKNMPISPQKPSENTPPQQPFSFRKADDIMNYLVSDGNNIRFRQSQQAYLYSHLGIAKSEEILHHIDIGNICHSILAQVKKTEDIDAIVQTFINKGIIDSIEQGKNIRSLVQDSWQRLNQEEWFNDYDKVLCEQAFIDSSQELRPDRVMIKGDRAIILDYKFGTKHNNAYIVQVKKYIQLFKQMGYNDVSGYIWYAQDKTMIRV